MKYFGGILLLSILFLGFQPDKASAKPPVQGAVLNGYVMDSESKETLIGATVYLKGTSYGAYTNKSGYFSIAGIPAGEYTVQISSIGYLKEERKMNFGEKSSVRKDFELQPADIMTREISVEADREVEKRQITVSKINVPVKTIKEIRIGGESDIFRSLQMLPGVLTSSQLSSGLYVRGGSPDQNLVLLDGTTVYNPTHLFGFISTFNTDAIKDVELIKGGFPAEYGGRLSAVLNATQKDGNKEEVEGIGSVGVITSKLGIEGPIGNGSWFAGGRIFNFALIKQFLSEDPENPIPDYNFYDLNGRISQSLGENDKLYLSGFMGADLLDFNNSGINMELDVGNRLGVLRWTHIFSDNMFSNVNLSASHYFNGFFIDQSGYEIKIDNEIRDYTLKASLEWFNSNQLTTKYGFEMSRYTFELLQNFTGETDSTQSGSSGGEVNLKKHDWNYSLYSQMNYQLNDFISLQAGLRGNYWNLSDIFTISPRAAVRYQFSKDYAIKAAWGIFHQNLRLASMQDFSFFDTWLPTDKSVPSSNAIHYVLTLETSPFEDYDLNFDVYYKSMHNINEVNQNAFEGDQVADVFYIGDAHSYGFEMFLQKKIGRLTGWAGYAFGYIKSRFDSINGGREFTPKYDRRHDFKIVMQYKISDSWDIGANFTFQSGQSYTGASSRFQLRLPGQNYGDGKTVPSERYGLRLPASHQLNINASYSFKTFGLPSRVIMDIYNVYNRRDIWFRYYDTGDEITKVEDVKLLPIIPTVSYEIKF